MADETVILIVDDNESARYTKSHALRRGGFSVIEAATGSDALRVIREQHPRLVVLDVHLPDIDGWEICRRVKGNPATDSVLVLQVSATYVREADTVHALDGGADACLTEPVEDAVLIATVRALLRARRAEDALREALATAEAANRTKDEFLAMLSHELRSPLGAILTWVTLLRTGHLDVDRTAHALEAIERNTRLQGRLIEDLLDTSRIISGKMRLEFGLVDLAAVVEAAIEAVRQAADAKNVTVQSTIGAVTTFSGDAARLQQVVWNLLSNAVKFTPKGGTVSIAVNRWHSNVRIEVTDTGRGIDPRFLPEMFNRFSQADSSATRTERGLGLGLSIVRQLVELHGGTVQAYSAGLGQGATFTVLLPVRSDQTKAVAADASGGGDGPLQPHPATLERLDGVSVLVVDDETDSREALAAVLEQCGARVRVAGSVLQARQALEHESCAVVVSDVAMPMEDGYQLIRELRARALRIPALAVTAFANSEERQRLLSAGYDDYLAKPVDAAELVRVVSRLARSAAQSAN
ncbi:MAG: response regulator [Candidatus Binatia bacterium]